MTAAIKAVSPLRFRTATEAPCRSRKLAMAALRLAAMMRSVELIPSPSRPHCDVVKTAFTFKPPSISASTADGLAPARVACQLASKMSSSLGLAARIKRMTSARHPTVR